MPGRLRLIIEMNNLNHEGIEGRREELNDRRRTAREGEKEEGEKEELQESQAKERVGGGEVVK